MALALWSTGFADQAQQRTDWLEQLARSLPHPPSLAYALAYLSILYQLRGEHQQSKAFAAEGFALATKFDLPLWTILTSILHSWVVASVDGEIGQVDSLQGAVDGYLGFGPQLMGSYLVYLLAEALVKHERYDNARVQIDRALELVAHNDEHFWEPELYRLQGDLFLKSGSGDNEVEQSYGTALDVADRFGTKALKLRVATSLGEFWKSRGKRQKALALVSGAFSVMTEGHDTADLRSAAELIGDLSK